MSFHYIINESLKSTGLKKIRIKTDPSMVSGNSDFRDVVGYEGYILAENLKNFKILVLNPEMTVADIPEELIEYIISDCSGIIDDFKEYAKQSLLKEKNKKENDPIFTQVQQSNNLEDIETFLKQNGYTDEDIYTLYRNFITK